MRYYLIYVKSGYVYTIIPGLPPPASANSLEESLATDDIIGTLSHPSPHTQKSYGYPQLGISSSENYAPPISNMFSRPQTLYQIVVPPYSQPSTLAPQDLSSQPLMHPQPQHPLPS